MNKEALSHLPVVEAVAQNGSFAGAAASLNMSASAVSHAVRMVEEALGSALFARTTRSVSLTEAGKQFLEVVGPALRAIDDAAERIAADDGRVTGVLRINASHVAAPMALSPIIAALAWRHPHLTVEIAQDDGLVDIVREGFDAGVRLGEMIAGDMIAVRLTPPFKAIMVASPAYIEAKGKPKTLADLKQHNCIEYRLIASGRLYAWDVNDQGRDVAIEVNGPVRVTDSLLARDLAIAGVGIAYLFEPLVRADIRERRLRWLLPEAAIEEPGLFLYFPRSAANMPKLRVFIDMAREVLRLHTK